MTPTGASVPQDHLMPIKSTGLFPDFTEEPIPSKPANRMNQFKKEKRLL
jgi:hypothetical protein